MARFNNYQSVLSTFHSAIDCEQANKNKEAYEKYAEGLSLISVALREDANLLPETHVVNMHTHLLEFAKRSTDRLLIILEKLGKGKGGIKDNKSDEQVDQESSYKKLSNTLPEIVTDKPLVNINFPDEVPDSCSPLAVIEEQKQRIIRCYENRIESLMNSQAKANLRLELERRLAENDFLSKKRHEQWERQRKELSEECQRIAQEKFYIQEKIKTGVVNDTDFTKQILYAACLQYHKEHPWAQEASCKIHVQIDDPYAIKKIISFILQHKSHPLACMLRQVQQKVLSKLSKLHLNQASFTKNEQTILQNQFKNISQDIKEDLFILTTVIQALWEPLTSESNQQIIIDVLHYLYFPSVKPYLIQLLRIVLKDQEEELTKCASEYTQRVTSYLPALNGIISKLHQLPVMHSPTAMMAFLVAVLRSFIDVSNDKKSGGDTTSLAMGIEDLMPKLIQLILISNMSTLPAEITFVENFMPAKKALGEEGYADRKSVV